jgi:hypothetical protein
MLFAAGRRCLLRLSTGFSELDRALGNRPPRGLLLNGDDVERGDLGLN